jgi:ketosteroid isomerase-like protein
MAAGPLSAAPPGQETAAKAAVEAVLDTFHAAAAAADQEAYLGQLAPGGLFLGTDAGERWTKEEFRAFVEPYFSRGRGWTYTPLERHVELSADGRVAWFDERLASASYGLCRGTGVLLLHGERWLIEQYHLSIPIPNDIAKEVVERIRAFKAAEDDG